MNPEYIIDLKTIILCAVLAYACVEILKPINEIFGIDRHTPKHRLTTRISSLLVGCLCGFFIYPALDGQGGDVLGIALGGASGALNAFLVSILKKKLKSKVEKTK